MSYRGGTGGNTYISNRSSGTGGYGGYGTGGWPFGGMKDGKTIIDKICLLYTSDAADE